MLRLRQATRIYLGCGTSTWNMWNNLWNIYCIYIYVYIIYIIQMYVYIYMYMYIVYIIHIYIYTFVLYIYILYLFVSINWIGLREKLTGKAPYLTVKPWFWSKDVRLKPIQWICEIGKSLENDGTAWTTYGPYNETYWTCSDFNIEHVRIQNYHEWDLLGRKIVI